VPRLGSPGCVGKVVGGAHGEPLQVRGGRHVRGTLDGGLQAPAGARDAPLLIALRQAWRQVCGAQGVAAESVTTWRWTVLQ
jgi:hypothetical protein